MSYTTINKGSSYFNTVLWTGNGGTQSITGVGFQPSLVWGKSRSVNYEQSWIDFIRGGTKYLFSNGNSAESTDANAITSFNADGFSIGSSPYIGNANGATYVGWNWLASNTTTNNTSGTISSVVSANQTAGFSVVSYTGNGTSGASIGHGLGSTPAMIICKSRSDAEEWATYHQSLTYTKYIVLNSTAAAVSTARFYQAPTSSLFYVDNGYGVNKSSATYIAYCFAEVKGYSKFGSYTGNGSTDGTFVYTGFKPAFLLTKRTDGVDSWVLYDNKRNTFNVEDKYLLPNLNNAEDTFIMYDFVSNGFKLRTTGSQNTSGWNLIYMAFAENPFVTSGGIPVTAR